MLELIWNYVNNQRNIIESRWVFWRIHIFGQKREQNNRWTALCVLSFIALFVCCPSVFCGVDLEDRTRFYPATHFISKLCGTICEIFTKVCPNLMFLCPVRAFIGCYKMAENHQISPFPVSLDRCFSDKYNRHNLAVLSCNIRDYSDRTHITDVPKPLWTFVNIKVC